jgi:hypothetical protein
MSVDEAESNILFNFMDNLGYGEVGCYGGGILRGAPTPNIDTLAREGTKLLNFNVGPQCKPTNPSLSDLIYRCSNLPRRQLGQQSESGRQVDVEVAPTSLVRGRPLSQGSRDNATGTDAGAASNRETLTLEPPRIPDDARGLELHTRIADTFQRDQ